MKLWRIWQTVNGGWGTFDAAIVAAETEEEARRIQPENGYPDTWAPFEDVSVMLIGEAMNGVEEGVILASFNSG